MESTLKSALRPPSSRTIIELNQVQLYPGTTNNITGMDLCIIFLMDLSKSTNNVTQKIMALLQDNTRQQQRLNNELMATELLQVPKLYKEKEGDDEPYKNSGEVQGFQTKNQQISSLRQFLQGKQGSAQQRAQINQKSVNATVSEAMQILQTADSLLKTLGELSYKASLTSSPKN